MLMAFCVDMRQASPSEIEVQEVADLCTLTVDAIVNAANAQLQAGSGVCGAVAKACGMGVFEECTKYLQGKASVEEGHAVITSAGNLKTVKHVIHAVGPKWDSGKAAECDKALYNAYYNSLLLADENKLASIAFPSLSTGIFGYPKDRAAPIAIRAVKEFISAHAQSTVKSIIFALWADTAPLYREALSK